MGKVEKKLGSIPADKLLHFISGMIVAIAAGFICYALAKSQHRYLEAFMIPKFQIACVGVFFAILAGIAKEGYDYVMIKKGKKSESSFEFQDIWWTVKGGIVGALLIWLISITIANGYYKDNVKTFTIQDKEKEWIENDKQYWEKDSVLRERIDSLKIKLKK